MLSETLRRRAFAEDGQQGDIFYQNGDILNQGDILFQIKVTFYQNIKTHQPIFYSSVVNWIRGSSAICLH